MSSLHEALVDYLAMRRALGYKLEREGKLLPQFVDFVEDRGEQHLSTHAALAWATLPAASAGWWSARLRLVRGFAIYLHAIDPESEVPASDLLPCAPRRDAVSLRPGADQRPARGGRNAAHTAPHRDDQDADRLAGGHRNADRRGDRA